MGRLVIGRRARQATFITIPPSDQPTQVMVSVDRIGGDKVHLLFDAPREVSVVRDDAVQTGPLYRGTDTTT